ncbi:LysM peptidoglycan-binding domain-containing protein, partial [Klebsiella pneumoniae]|nr:LysM peptidoglycan-binding domain-containing protein [Klebsiella pneumoniae]
YRVQAGDSLWSIAQRHNTSIANIKSLNNLSSNLIFPNQVLKVAGSANTSSQRTSGGSSVSGGSTYTVQPGDSLSLIASKYGTTYQNIMRLNGLNGFLIHPGQVLKVSGTASNSTTTSNTTRVSGGSVYTVQPGDSLSLIAS